MRGRLSVAGVTVDCGRGERSHGVNFDNFGQTREGVVTAWVVPSAIPAEWDKETVAELDGRRYRIESAKLDNRGVFVRFVLVKPLKDSDHP